MKHLQSIVLLLATPAAGCYNPGAHGHPYRHTLTAHGGTRREGHRRRCFPRRGPGGPTPTAVPPTEEPAGITSTTGQAKVITVFEGLPGPFPNPNRRGAMEADPVPKPMVHH